MSDPRCIFCGNHPYSHSCKTVYYEDDRLDFFDKNGICFCLKNNHLPRNIPKHQCRNIPSCGWCRKAGRFADDHPKCLCPHVIGNRQNVQNQNRQNAPQQNQHQPQATQRQYARPYPNVKTFKNSRFSANFSKNLPPPKLVDPINPNFRVFDARDPAQTPTQQPPPANQATPANDQQQLACILENVNKLAEDIIKEARKNAKAIEKEAQDIEDKAIKAHQEALEFLEDIKKEYKECKDLDEYSRKIVNDAEENAKKIREGAARDADLVRSRAAKDRKDKKNGSTNTSGKRKSKKKNLEETKDLSQDFDDLELVEEIGTKDIGINTLFSIFGSTSTTSVSTQTANFFEVIPKTKLTQMLTWYAVHSSKVQDEITRLMLKTFKHNGVKNVHYKTHPIIQLVQFFQTFTDEYKRDEKFTQNLYTTVEEVFDQMNLDAQGKENDVVTDMDIDETDTIDPNVDYKQYEDLLD